MPFSKVCVRECFNCNEVIDPFDAQSFTTWVIASDGTDACGYDAPLCRDCWVEEHAEDVVREMDALKQAHFARLHELTGTMHRHRETTLASNAAEERGALLCELHQQACQAVGVNHQIFDESQSNDLIARMLAMPWELN
jgi:hypothetical protein